MLSSKEGTGITRPTGLSNRGWLKCQRRWLFELPGQGPASAGSGALEATIINILPSVILIVQPRRGSHPELGAPWELPQLHSWAVIAQMGTLAPPGRAPRVRRRAEDAPQPTLALPWPPVWEWSDQKGWLRRAKGNEIVLCRPSHTSCPSEIPVEPSSSRGSEASLPNFLLSRGWELRSKQKWIACSTWIFCEKWLNDKWREISEALSVTLFIACDFSDSERLSGPLNSPPTPSAAPEMPHHFFYFQTLMPIKN